LPALKDWLWSGIGQSQFNFCRAKTYIDTIDGFIRVVTDGKEIQVDHSRKRSTDRYEEYEYKALGNKESQ